MTRALRSRGVGTLRLPSVGLAKFVAVVVIAASLAGCNYDPAYVDALHGLANVPSTSVPQDVPVIVEQPVALVPSENSAMLLQSVKDYINSTNGKLGKALMPDYEWADGDPQPMVDGAVNVLRRRYPKAELVDDLATAKQRGFRTTFVIDIQSHHITSAFDTNHVTMTYIVMDADQKPLSRFSGEGSSHTTYGSMDPHFRDAVAMAVANLDAKSTQLLQGGGK